ncbi:hypothetical protein AAG747_21020 [Rapidithrix thailandica]|uniref:Uncharacterized protein n=1 Tax=Rapidithrix thailandica TaxID=413964 RepID=A0AAW9SDK5_9BACT
MAHSYISTKKGGYERTVCVTDSILHVFIYFFIVSSNDCPSRGVLKPTINSYLEELSGNNISFMDLYLEEFIDEKSIRKSYLEVLGLMKRRIESYGESIQNEILNNLSEMKKVFNKPVPTKKIFDLINDVSWLLHKESVHPSDSFKWFEDKL